MAQTPGSCPTAGVQPRAALGPCSASLRCEEDLLGWSFQSRRQGRTLRLQGDVWEAPCCPRQGWAPGFRLGRGTRRTSPGSAGCHPGTASGGCRSRTRSARGCSSTTPAHTGGRQPSSTSRQSSPRSRSSRYTSGQHKPRIWGCCSRTPGTLGGCGASHHRAAPAHPLRSCSC